MIWAKVEVLDAICAAEDSRRIYETHLFMYDFVKSGRIELKHVEEPDNSGLFIFKLQLQHCSIKGPAVRCGCDFCWYF